MPWQGTHPLEANPYARQRALEAFMLPYQARQAQIDRNNAIADENRRANLEFQVRNTLADEAAQRELWMRGYQNAWESDKMRLADELSAQREAEQFSRQWQRDYLQDYFQQGRDSRQFGQQSSLADQSFQQNRTLQNDRMDWQAGQGDLEHQRALERQAFQQENQRALQAESLAAQRERELFQTAAQAQRDERGYAFQAERDQFGAQQTAQRQQDQQAARSLEMRQQEKWRWDSYREHETAVALQKGIVAYTPRQKQELARLTDALQQVESSDDLDDGQRLAAGERIRRKIGAIRPLPVPLDQRPLSMEEDWESNTRVVDDGHGPYRVQRVRSKDGSSEWRAIRGAPVPVKATPEKKPAEMTDKDRQHLDLARMKEMRSYATDLMKQTKEESSADPDRPGKKIVRSVPVYTPDQAWDEARRRFPVAGPGGTAEMPTESPSTAQGVAAPRSQEEYNALPSGAVFVDPNGVRRRKP